MLFLLDSQHLLAKLIRTLLPASLSIMLAAACYGQTKGWEPSVKTHAWGRFGAHAWKVTRIRTDAFDDNGQLERTSVTITRTQVNAVGRNSLSLCVSSTVAVAGQEIASDPHIITRGIGQSLNPSDKVGDESLPVGDTDFKTEIYRLQMTKGANKQTNTVYFCREAKPQILKRVAKTVNEASGEVQSTTTVRVTATGKTMEVLGAERSCWTVKTQSIRPLVEITSQEVYCEDVPGELVSRITEERNSKGQIVRRSELEVTGYGLGNQRRRIFGRRRQSRPPE